MKTLHLIFKQSPLFALMVGVPSLVFATADGEIIPKGFDVSRYETLWKTSPFTLASAAAEGPGGFADQLVLVGFWKLGGSNSVVIRDKQKQTWSTVTQTPNPDGVSLVSIQESNQETTATIKKGEETATLKFDRVQIAATAPAQLQNPQAIVNTTSQVQTSIGMPQNNQAPQPSSFRRRQRVIAPPGQTVAPQPR